MNMKSEDRKKQLIEAFADVSDKTDIRDVVGLVDRYYEEFPDSCYSDLASCPHKHKRIGQAIAIHFIHHTHKVPLETAILDIIGEELEKELLSKHVDYDHGIKSMKCGNLGCVPLVGEKEMAYPVRC